MVEVAGLVVLDWALDSCGVVDMRVCVTHFHDRTLDSRRATIVAYEDAVAVLRVVQTTGCASSVEDDIQIFVAACNENVHTWHIVSHKGILLSARHVQGKGSQGVRKCVGNYGIVS